MYHIAPFDRALVAEFGPLSAVSVVRRAFSGKEKKQHTVFVYTFPEIRVYYSLEQSAPLPLSDGVVQALLRAG